MNSEPGSSGFRPLPSVANGKKAYLCINNNWEMVMNRQSTKELLIEKLLKHNGFWSFDVQHLPEVTDDILIEKALLYLDIEDINMLFKIYPFKKIKQVWLERLAVQGDYFARLNKLLAWMYFDIKQPDRYLKRLENRRFKTVS
ncbi:MAG TPA: hypothetical protein VLQ91_21035 [Draconibacterium sp.]|nr:hypothetical protein [Draconibacterium sp.]